MLKVTYEHIGFDRNRMEVEYHRKNKMPWIVYNLKQGTVLGSLDYCNNYYRWEFKPRENFSFVVSVLRDIADFMAQLERGEDKE
jgi:hypothetical protein